jgi:penicillin-binding protein 2
MEGLRQAVEEQHGTGHHVKYGDGTSEVVFDVPDVRMMGKTGTAQAPPLAWDEDGDGSNERVVKGLDHSWFVGLVGDRGDSTPRYAVAVIVEYGGSGGKTAGPVAEQVIRALVEEGYLGDEARPSKERPRRRRADYAPEPGELGPPDEEATEG